ncbi:MAG: hypothetical protein MRZ35_02615 [Firmicutes bacterium]|nr:hypothetical protein [Bacillota bacterium]
MKKILHPNNFVLVIGGCTIIFSLIYLIFFNGFGSTISYVLYLIMTYFFIVICIKLYILFKKIINRVVDKNKYLRKYKNDYKLRYKISLIVSLIFNLLYALFKLLSGIIFRSVWFISFAFYYILLVIVRYNIAKQKLDDSTTLKDEYIKYKNVGVILLFINVILTFIVLIIVNEQVMNIYPSWIAITVATYTFYLIFISIYNLIKYRKYKSPLMASSKIVNVVTSLVSLISLEIILIPTFGNVNDLFFEVMIMTTGGGIALIVFIISLYMIIRSTEWLGSFDKK